MMQRKHKNALELGDSSAAYRSGCLSAILDKKETPHNVSFEVLSDKK